MIAVKVNGRDAKQACRPIYGRVGVEMIISSWVGERPDAAGPPHPLPPSLNPFSRPFSLPPSFLSPPWAVEKDSAEEVMVYSYRHCCRNCWNLLSKVSLEDYLKVEISFVFVFGGGVGEGTGNGSFGAA